MTPLMVWWQPVLEDLVLKFPHPVLLLVALSVVAAAVPIVRLRPLKIMRAAVAVLDSLGE